KCINYRTYNVEFAVQQLGKFFLDFADQYERDRTKSEKTLTWKFESFRLQQALNTLSEQAPQNARPKVEDFIKVARGVLKQIEKSREPGLAAVRRWLDTKALPPAESTLYRGEKEGSPKNDAGS